MPLGVAALLSLALLLAVAPLTPPAATASAAAGPYTNPLAPQLSDGRMVEACPDPSVLRGRGAHAGRWYMYCTAAALDNGVVSHRLPMLSSQDLVHWKLSGSAVPKPAWAAAGAHLWAPDVVYATTTRRYYLTYTVTDTVEAVSGEAGCQGDSAIGLATSGSPVGPWRPAPGPLVPPRRTGPGCSFASTIDSDVLGDTVGAGGVLFYGGFRGGLEAQRFSVSRYRLTMSGTRRSITTRRYEAANVVRRGDYYYLFASAGHCCKGSLSEYSVFAGRSIRPMGPYVDREGNSLLAARTGGTPVLTSSGNRWSSPGHNSVFRDLGGQWWTAYHAVDLTEPSFTGRPASTRRPAMLDPVDWVRGWPSVRAGLGPSATQMPGPAAQPGQHTAYQPRPAVPDVRGTAIAGASDEFDDDSLEPRWTWVREPDPATYRLTGTALELQTHAGDFSGENRAPVLTSAAPVGDYVLETTVRLDVPRSGDIAGHVRAGLVVYDDDDHYVGLMHGAPGSVRLTEFAKKVPAGDVPGVSDYGVMSVGPPGDVTGLRLVHRVSDGRHLFRAYTQQDGRRWVRGGTWVSDGLPAARIGLVAFGGVGHTASFDHVRAWTLG